MMHGTALVTRACSELYEVINSDGTGIVGGTTETVGKGDQDGVVTAAIATNGQSQRRTLPSMRSF